MKSIFCLCLLLWQCSVALAWNEPDSFMGIKFFLPIAEGTMKECSEEDLAWPRGSKDLFPELPKTCWRGYGPGSSEYTIKYITFGDFWFDGTAQAVTGKIAHINMMFPNADYGTIYRVFKERYGSPTSVKKESWRSQGGASFQNEITKWQGRRLIITLLKLGPRVDKGYISYDTDLWIKHSAKKEADAIKKSVKGL